MINQETSDKLKVLGFDVPKLVEAVKAEDEQSLDVPELFTKEQKEEFAKNFSSSRFEEGKTAMSEIKAKELKAKFNIDIEGKDLDKVVDAIIDSKTKGIEKPNEKITELEEKVKRLQKMVVDKEEEGKKLTSEYQNKLFQNKIDTQILALTPKGAKLQADQLLVLYKSGHQLKQDEEGNTLISKDGEVLKDNLLSPLKVKEHYPAWLEENKFIDKAGMNGKDRGGAGSSKFKSMEEFNAYCQENNLEPMSSEAQKLLLENKEFELGRS